MIQANDWNSTRGLVSMSHKSCPSPLSFNSVLCKPYTQLAENNAIFHSIQCKYYIERLRKCIFTPSDSPQMLKLDVWTVWTRDVVGINWAFYELTQKIYIFTHLMSPGDEQGASRFQCH